MACTDIDPSRPVHFVLEGTWRDSDANKIRRAARIWNTEFCTDLQVDQAQAAEQEVTVQLSDFVCAFASGLAQEVGGPQIQICSTLRGNALMQVAAHEMGHILNIDDHAVDPNSVMATWSNSWFEVFTGEDHQLFWESNPDYQGQPGCHLVEPLTRTERRPAVVGHPASPAYLFWAEENRLRYAPLEVAAERLSPAGGTIATAGIPSFIQAVAIDEGYAVYWLEEADLYRTVLSLPSGAVDPPLRLEIAPLAAFKEWDPQDPADEATYQLQVVERGQEAFILAQSAASLSYYGFSVNTATGKELPCSLNSPDQEELRVGRILASHDQLYLVSLQISSNNYSLVQWYDLSLVRLGADGRPDATLLVDSWSVDFGDYSEAARQNKARSDILLALAVGADGSSLLLYQSSKLYRVRVGDAGPELLTAALLEEEHRINNEGDLCHIALADVAEGVVMAFSCAWVDLLGVHEAEVEAARFDGQTLALTQPWQVISADDNMNSHTPQLVVEDGRQAVLWMDGWSTNYVKLRRLPGE